MPKREDESYRPAHPSACTCVECVEAHRRRRLPPHVCPDCLGSGRVSRWRDALDDRGHLVRCPMCLGSGVNPRPTSPSGPGHEAARRHAAEWERQTQEAARNAVEEVDAILKSPPPSAPHPTPQAAQTRTGLEPTVPVEYPSPSARQHQGKQPSPRPLPRYARPRPARRRASSAIRKAIALGAGLGLCGAMVAAAYILK